MPVCKEHAEIYAEAFRKELSALLDKYFPENVEAASQFNFVGALNDGYRDYMIADVSHMDLAETLSARLTVGLHRYAIDTTNMQAAAESTVLEAEMKSQLAAMLGIDPENIQVVSMADPADVVRYLDSLATLPDNQGVED